MLLEIRYALHLERFLIFRSVRFYRYGFQGCSLEEMRFIYKLIRQQLKTVSMATGFYCLCVDRIEVSDPQSDTLGPTGYFQSYRMMADRSCERDLTYSSHSPKSRHRSQLIWDLSVSVDRFILRNFPYNTELCGRCHLTSVRLSVTKKPK